MDFRGDRRGVTVQVGAVLLLGFLVISLSLYQATVVPSENKEVEFQHSRQVQEQMGDLRNALVRTAGVGSSQPTSVDLGTRYPARTVFVNPPPPGGTLRTVDTADPSVTVAVTGAESTDREVDDFWNGTTREYNTGTLVYDPGYNVYDGAPTTVYENTVLYGAFDDGATTRLRSGAAVVDGRQVHVVLLAGNLSASGVDATSVDARPLSVSTNRVTLRNPTEPINVTLPTRLSASQWQDALAGETNVTVGDAPGTAVNLTLAAGTTYELKVSRVGVGDATPDDGGPQYLTQVDGPAGAVVNDTTVRYTVEVRDRFNNPASGTRVTATATNGDVSNGTGTPATPTAFAFSDADGRATFAFRPQCPPADATCPARLSFSIRGGQQDFEVVEPEGGTIRVTAGNASGDTGTDGGSDINPAQSGDIVLTGERVDSQDSTRAILELNNTARNRPVNITQARINFYLETQTSNKKQFDSAVLEDDQGTNRSAAPIDIKGPFVGVDNVTIANNTAQSTEIALDFESEQQGGNAKITTGEFFVVTLRFDNGETDTYFVAPA